MKSILHHSVSLVSCVALVMMPIWSASSQGSAPFYAGKQVRLVTSAGIGGGFSQYARLMARHMSNHLPGKPNIVVQSMPGAGGLLATNYLYAQAPQDGTYIGLVHTSIPLAPLLGAQGARFDPLKFHWLGSLDRADGPCLAWHTAPAKTWEDLLKTELIVGSSGVGSPMDVYPAVLNKLFGTKIKVISGYKDGATIFFAMERGEIHGRCGPQSAIKALHPTWIPEKKVVAPIVVGDRRNSDFPNTPAILEIAKDERIRQQLRLLITVQNFDRPVLAPPGVPSERLKELKEGFTATMEDPAFRAEIERSRLTLDWVQGEEVQKSLLEAYAMPSDIVMAVKEILAPK